MLSFHPHHTGIGHALVDASDLRITGAHSRDGVAVYGADADVPRGPGHVQGLAIGLPQQQGKAEILKHTYEYTVREDILLALEYHDLPDARAKALLASPSPLADVFADWESEDTGYMDDIWQTVEDRAKAEADKQRQAKSKQTSER